MAPFNQYGNFYDPVGSHANQPQGCTYQTATVSQAPYLTSQTSTYQTPSYHNQNNVYEEQRYNSAAQHTHSVKDANRAAAAVLSNIGTQGYPQPGPTDRFTGMSTQYNSSSDSNRYNQAQNTYGQVPSRGQSSRSPLYPSNEATSSFGRDVGHAAPQEDTCPYNDPQGVYQANQTARQAQLFRGSQSLSSQTGTQSYQGSNPQPSTKPPLRYNSPLPAIQCQQNRNRQSPGSSTQHPSPQMTNLDVQASQEQQQRGSVDPSPTTVDPTQVYDFRAEQHRKAEQEVQRRKKAEAEEAAKRAMEEARQAEVERVNQEKQKADEYARRMEAMKREEDERTRKAVEDAAKKRATQERRKEQRRKAREEKKQSDSAASTLQQIASGSVDSSTQSNGTNSDAAPKDDETQMRALFKIMREVNQRNPEMLARMWEEERRAHMASKQEQPIAVESPTVPQQLSADKSKKATSRSTPKSTKTSADKGQTAPPVVTKTQVSQGQAEPPVNAPIAIPLHFSHVLPQKAAGNPAAPQQATTTVWPPQKKGMLAESAANWLNNLQANKSEGRRISKEAILEVLDSNPSYQQLCESIEKAGMTFDRPVLAREILKLVPEAMKTQAMPRTAQIPPNVTGQDEASTSGLVKVGHGANGQPRGGTSTVKYQTPGFVPLADAARDVNSITAVPTVQNGRARVQIIGAPPENYHSPYVMTPAGNNHGNIRYPIPNPPEIKIETYTLSHTQPKPPADKEEAARKRTFSDLVDLTQGDSDDEMPPRKLQQHHPISRTPNMNQLPPPSAIREPMTFQQYQQQALHQPRQPQTFPPMQSNLPAPSAPSPAAKVIPPPKPKGPTPEQLQLERVKGKMLVEPLMRDRVARKSTYDSRSIARDVLLATGRHPDMRPLNAHLHTMDKLLSTHGGVADGPGNKSDLSTIRWDIVDPGNPPQASNVASKTPSAGDSFEDVDDQDDVHVDSEGGQIIKAAYRTQNGNFAEKKRRGRPPGPSKHESAIDFGTPTRSQTPKLQQKMSSSTTPAGNVGYAAFRQLDEHGNVIKKKGRPVGWRKSVHSREAHGLTPAKSLSANHPPVATQLKEVELQQPHYQVFRCQWFGCSSELHNLEVLKKHVIKVHGQTTHDGVYECAWRKCPAATEQTDGQATTRTVARFDNIESWLQHVDKQHLRDIAWKQGDGPRGGSLSDQAALALDPASSYLSDAFGRSVTPVISPGSAGTSDRPSQMSFSEHQLRRNLSKDERKAAGELKKLEDSKRAEGLTMGTEGTRLANAKRRRGFLDDEDFADEVESSELGEDP